MKLGLLMLNNLRREYEVYTAFLCTFLAEPHPCLCPSLCPSLCTS